MNGLETLNRTETVENPISARHKEYAKKLYDSMNGTIYDSKSNFISALKEISELSKLTESNSFEKVNQVLEIDYKTSIQGIVKNEGLRSLGNWVGFSTSEINTINGLLDGYGDKVVIDNSEKSTTTTNHNSIGS